MKQRFMVETKLSNTQLTKIITIFPMFVVLNKCETTLFYQESFVSSPSTPLATEEDDTGIHHLDTDGEDDEVDDGNNGLLPTIRALANLWVKIEPGEAKPFWPTRFGKSLSMVLKTDQSNEVSHTFSASIPQRTLLTWSDQQSAVTAEVSGGLGTEYFITLRPYQLGDAVVRLENLTQYSLLFSQGNTSSGKTLTVPSSKSWLYFWPNPMADRKLFWSVPELKSKHTIAHFSQDFSSQVNCQGHVIYCQSYRDNLQRVLTFSDHESFQQIIHKRNQKEQATLFAFSALDSVRLSLVNSSSLEIALISANQSPSCWSVKLEGADGESRWYDLGEKLSSVIESAYCNCLTEPVYQNRDIEINFRELAFVRPISGVLKRESFPGIKLQYQKSDLSMALQASVNYLQDTVPDRCSAHTIKHSSNIASSRLTTSLKAVVSIERFSLKIDKGFLLSSLDYITNCTKTDTDNYNTVMVSVVFS
ncbi:hypothetical protein EB796_003048 [Bugula neritina]|uniref:Uncharacterized protein n=1 Tax=Bugula neritina TaxID=10212 RepID=A0A7J7KK36_BUGNE|nr:hypothetical protein EB796_003048 [Bugula neritina]